MREFYQFSFLTIRSAIQSTKGKDKMIKFNCSTYPASDKKEVFSLEIANWEFVIDDYKGNDYRGNRVHLFSQLPDVIVNDISLSLGEEQKEVFRSAKLNPEIYIHEASGELNFRDAQGREWKIVVLPIEHYQGGKNYIFSLYQWPSERLWQFMPSFLSWSCSGDFLAIENGVIRIGRDMNQGRHMLRVKEASGVITFNGKRSLSLSYPLDPGDYKGMLQNGTMVLPTRIQIKSNSFQAYNKKEEDETKEILEEGQFSDIRGFLTIITEDGFKYFVEAQKIAGLWRFVMAQIWNDGTKNIVDIGDRIRFACLKAPDGVHPELKFIGLETEYGMSVPLL